jgi:hypothetical protein
MLRLRALIHFGLSTCMLLTSLQSYAFRQTFSSTYEVRKQGGHPDVFDLRRRVESETQSLRLGHAAEGLPFGFSTFTTFKVESADYSSVLLTDSAGLQRPLSDSYPQTLEASVDLEAQVNRGSRQLNLGLFGNLSRSPYARQGLRVGFRQNFFNQSTALGLKVLAFAENQPQSYFLNSNLQWSERPRQTPASEVSAFLEQTFTESWKGMIELSSAKRVGERPRNVGVSLSQAYAVNDRLFARVQLRHYSELRSESLVNERGYFDLNSLELSATAEPLVDLLFTASYAFVVEREWTPWDNKVLQVGSDRYGLALRYALRQVEVDLQTSYGETNTRAYDFQMTGGLTWQI